VSADVAIVGAGISGLACAAELSRHGVSAVIFEARAVIGGRICTYRPPDGGPELELGAQVIHGDRNPVRDLAEHGTPASPRSRPVPRDVTAWAVLGGRVRPFGVLASDGAPPWAVEQRLTADDDDQGDIPVSAWLERQGLADGDLRSAAEWFRQNWAAEPAMLSAPGVAAARRGDRPGDGEFAFEGGFGSLTDALAPGLDIRVGTPVRALTWSPGRVELTAENGEQIAARAAVITAPPPVITCGRLVITPLPVQKAAAAAALPSGDALCVIATLSREVPESGVVFDVDGHMGFVRYTRRRPEVLIVAKAAAAAAVRTARLEDLVGTVLPCRMTAEVISARVADWGTDPWSAGAFCYPKVGCGWASPAWARPIDRTLFFAGEATTARSLPPTVHSALGSGLRAAGELMEAWGR
jgi:monoamine oxidase